MVQAELEVGGAQSPSVARATCPHLSISEPVAAAARRVAAPTQVGARRWEAAQAGGEPNSRPAFHPPQGWSLGEEESAAGSSLALIVESQEKMEPSKMAPLKNAPRDALVSARGARPGALGGRRV